MLGVFADVRLVKKFRLFLWNVSSVVLCLSARYLVVWFRYVSLIGKLLVVDYVVWFCQRHLGFVILVLIGRR